MITSLPHCALISCENRSRPERLANLVARVAGNTPFIILHLVWFGAWVVLNLGVVSAIPPWDPFPFSFLTLVVSLEAIFLSLLVLMAQNRLTRDADKRAHLDLQINMLAGQESTTTLARRPVQIVEKNDC